MGQARIAQPRLQVIEMLLVKQRSLLNNLSVLIDDMIHPIGAFIRHSFSSSLYSASISGNVNRRSAVFRLLRFRLTVCSPASASLLS